jgi:AcrR family transcriptional regulator
MKNGKKQIRLSGTERVDQIYSIAAQMICEKGFDATSMSAIAEAVGITKAGVYHFIPSKKELLFAIMSWLRKNWDCRPLIVANFASENVCTLI